MNINCYVTNYIVYIQMTKMDTPQLLIMVPHNMTIKSLNIMMIIKSSLQMKIQYYQQVHLQKFIIPNLKNQHKRMRAHMSLYQRWNPLQITLTHRENKKEIQNFNSEQICMTNQTKADKKINLSFSIEKKKTNITKYADVLVQVLLQR